MNKIKTFLKGKLSLPAVASLFVAVLITVTVFAAGPSATPTGGNVDANFSSITLPKGPKMASTVSLYVGQTSSTYNGSGVGGYNGGQAKCSAAFADSHVCTAKEIANSYEYDAAGPIASASGNAWINNGPPAYISDLSNDCKGWTSNEPVSDGYSSYGSTWKFSTKYSLISHCSRSLPIACCSN
ncbi:MAG: hypothetical protein U0519_00800 [Candidatus Gracilibacteria bacterium]